MSSRTIPGIMEELDAAAARLEARRIEAAHARTMEVEALNAVNRLQKELDAAIAEMRKAAPRDSDWDREPWRTVRVLNAEG